MQALGKVVIKSSIKLMQFVVVTAGALLIAALFVIRFCKTHKCINTINVPLLQNVNRYENLFSSFNFSISNKSFLL